MTDKMKWEREFRIDYRQSLEGDDKLTVVCKREADEEIDRLKAENQTQHMTILALQREQDFARDRIAELEAKLKGPVYCGTPDTRKCPAVKELEADNKALNDVLHYNDAPKPSEKPKEV